MPADVPQLHQAVPIRLLIVKETRQSAMRFYSANDIVVTCIGEKCPVPNARA